MGSSLLGMVFEPISCIIQGIEEIWEVKSVLKVNKSNILTLSPGSNLAEKRDH